MSGDYDMSTPKWVIAILTVVIILMWELTKWGFDWLYSHIQWIG